jgi:hypothetical protein
MNKRNASQNHDIIVIIIIAVILVVVVVVCLLLCHKPLFKKKVLLHLSVMLNVVDIKPMPKKCN